LLGSLGLDGGIRAESMDVEELIALAEALKGRLGTPAEADPESADDD
jgi:hypothetical protein